MFKASSRADVSRIFSEPLCVQWRGVRDSNRVLVSAKAARRKREARVLFVQTGKYIVWFVRSVVRLDERPGGPGHADRGLIGDDEKGNRYGNNCT